MIFPPRNLVALVAVILSSRVISFTPRVTNAHNRVNRYDRSATVTGTSLHSSNNNDSQNTLSVATATALLAWSLFSGTAVADGTFHRSVFVAMNETAERSLIMIMIWDSGVVAVPLLLLFDRVDARVSR